MANHRCIATSPWSPVGGALGYARQYVPNDALAGPKAEPYCEKDKSDSQEGLARERGLA